MSDMIDGFRDLKAMRAREREVFGVPCPVCQQKLPKAHATILLPGRWCRAHKPYYCDSRPQPSADEWMTAMNGQPS